MFHLSNRKQTERLTQLSSGNSMVNVDSFHQEQEAGKARSGSGCFHCDFSVLYGHEQVWVDGYAHVCICIRRSEDNLCPSSGAIHLGLSINHLFEMKFLTAWNSCCLASRPRQSACRHLPSAGLCVCAIVPSFSARVLGPTLRSSWLHGEHFTN